MPIYEYLCRDHGCAHVLTTHQGITEEPIKLCPACGGVTERIIFAPALDFRGGGWTSPGF